MISNLINLKHSKEKGEQNDAKNWISSVLETINIVVSQDRDSNLNNGFQSPSVNNESLFYDISNYFKTNDQFHTELEYQIEDGFSHENKQDDHFEPENNGDNESGK